MTYVFITYNKQSGEIQRVQAGGNAPPEAITPEGYAVVTVAYEHEGSYIAPSNRSHYIDPVTLELEDKSPLQQAYCQVPQDWEVKHAISMELMASDGYMAPDRPMLEEMRSKWREYRQALRDLSKLSTPYDMIMAWPDKPDNTDAVPLLKSRTLQYQALRDPTNA